MVQQVDSPLPSDKQIPHWYWQVYKWITNGEFQGTITVHGDSTIQDALHLTTDVARGSGSIYISFYDPTGIKGHVGYTSSSTDVLAIVNALNAPLVFYTNNTLQLTIAAGGDATFVGNVIAPTVKTTPVTVAGLPAAGTVGKGTRAFVTDATVAVFATVVTGGGANNVPVYSDGTNWLIG